MRGEGTFVTYFRPFQQLFSERAAKCINMQISCTLSTYCCCSTVSDIRMGKYIFANIARIYGWYENMHEGKMNATWFPSWSSSTAHMNDVVEWKIRFEWEGIFKSYISQAFILWQTLSLLVTCTNEVPCQQQWKMCWKIDDRLISRLTKNVN